MQRQISNLHHGLQGIFATRFGALLAMAGLLLLSACDGAGNAVTENNLADPVGKDGVAPTLTSVSIRESTKSAKPSGFVKLGKSVRIDIVASEALMAPVVTINGAEVEVIGKVNTWYAVREMTEADTLGEVYFSIRFQDISLEPGLIVTTTTDGSAVVYCDEDCPEPVGSLAGDWRLDPAGGSGVGPNEGDISWWNTGLDGVAEARACWLDDTYVLGADGSFRNVQGDESWIEEFAGGPEGGGCGVPVAPHDGSTAGTWVYDEAASTITISGTGSYLGLPKVANGFELASPGDAPDSVTYNVTALEGDTMTVTIDYGGGWWQFRLVRQPVSPLAGKWKIGTEGGSGVGPTEGDVSWWNTGLDGVAEARGCWLDDVYEFDADGSFSIVQNGESWIEEFAGGPEGGGCGATVAPHDGSNSAIFEYDEDASTLKLTGVGAYIGLPKAVNGAELGSPGEAPESVTYNVAVLDGDTMTVTIDYGGGWWQFQLTRVSNSPLVGNWQIGTEGGSGVGPNEGDVSWWNTGLDGVAEARPCWLDDIYHFGADGTFQNFQEGESWIEEFAGGPDGGGCGATVAPHDGSNSAVFEYDADASTLKLTGVGAYIGLPKAVNGAELGSPGEAPESVTYNVAVLDGDTLTVTIDYGGGWWQFQLTRVTATALVAGKWKIGTEGGSGVGPTEGDVSWWNTGLDGVAEARGCWLDDVYEFDADGSFSIVQNGESWIEEFAGGPEGGGCGATVAPHDGSNSAIFEYDEDASTLKLTGVGAYIGLPKAVNGAELGSPGEAPESVTYNVAVLDGDTMTVTIDYGGGWWQFQLTRVSNSPLVGNWQIGTEGGSGVGPNEGDVSWWNTGLDGVAEARPCWLDDIYHFGADGTFQNFQEGESWIEEFAGGPDGGGCGATVAPHDGSNSAVFEYDADASTLKLTGVGAYIGLPKAVNGAELGSPGEAPESVTYKVAAFDAGIITVTIDYGGGWWQFQLGKK